MHPRDKAKRYAAELKSRTGADGKRLTNNQINFRIGYLRARQDARAAYRAYRQACAREASIYKTFDAEEAFQANLRRGQFKKNQKK